MEKRRISLGLAVLLVLVLTLVTVHNHRIASKSSQGSNSNSTDLGYTADGRSPNSGKPRPSSSKNQSSLAQVPSVNGWRTYNSSVGKFSFKYPQNWSVDAPDYSSTGVYVINIRTVGPTTSRPETDDFNMSLNVEDNPDSASPPTRIPYGSVQELSKQIHVWVSDLASAAAARPPSYCPEMELVNTQKTHMSLVLRDGRYLTLRGGYCELLNDKPTASYDQQLKSDDWLTALAIVKSIAFQ